MNKLKFNIFPGGKSRALTLSYDDGREYDRRLVDMFNRYGIKGTFHLNSGIFGDSAYVQAKEVASLYRGHEVSIHTVNHYDLTIIPHDLVVSEIQNDRKTLEDLVGYPVRGMSYPFGTFNDSLVQTLASLGIEYSRTTRTTKGFQINSDFRRWKSTCHHSENLLETAQRFLSENINWTYKLMYVWGHSYEFENDNSWDMMEEFCRAIGNLDEIWYATNIEIVDYINAVRGLRISVDSSKVFNPSATDVWIEAGGNPVKIAGGTTIRL